MKHFLIPYVLLFGGNIAIAQEDGSNFSSLNTMIDKQLSSGSWHPASIALIRTQWTEFQRAHLKPGQRGNFSGARFHCGLLVAPKIETIKDYAGAYYFTNFKGDLTGPPHLKIVVSPRNRVFVIENGRRLPAVVNNKIIFFTTGELTKKNAQFGNKPYAELELKMIYQTENNKFVTGPTASPFDDLLSLTKRNTSISNTEKTPSK